MNSILMKSQFVRSFYLVVCSQAGWWGGASEYNMSGDTEPQLLGLIFVWNQSHNYLCEKQNNCEDEKDQKLGKFTWELRMRYEN